MPCAANARLAYSCKLGRRSKGLTLPNIQILLSFRAKSRNLAKRYLADFGLDLSAVPQDDIDQSSKSAGFPAACFL